MAPKKIEEQYLHGIVRLVILFYDRTSTAQSQENLLQKPLPSQNSSNIMLLSATCMSSKLLSKEVISGGKFFVQIS